MLRRNLWLGATLFALVTACGTEQAPTSAVKEAQNDQIVFEVRKVETTPEEAAQIAAMFAAKANDPMVPPALNTDRVFETESIDVAAIINIAKQVWTIIEKNKPVANIATDYATAVPQGITDFLEMTDFSELTSQSYEWVGKNLFKGEVFNVRYTVVNQYGGRYQGKGRYLTTVGIVPSHVKVAWGWKLDFTARQVSITNLGSAEEPIASIALDLVMKANSPLTNITDTRLYQVRGDNGKIIEK